ncbi:hypothetical protein ABZ837_17620 [Streptomyces sp. NPDC047197]|uniref:hypothetical protein n=1 Tax=Streptomyces sp. NPDC047197 TaxID=3155477 RepID=UPI0033C2FE79
MQADGELSDLVQLPLETLGGAGKVEGQMRQRVEEVGSPCRGPFGLSGVGRVQGGDCGEHVPALGLKVVVRLPEATGEGVVRIRVLGLT